jgi:hypothetical protein
MNTYRGPVDKDTYSRIRNTGRMEGRDAERERIKRLLRDPSRELITFVAAAIKDGKLGPVQAAIGAVCDWIDK